MDKAPTLETFSSADLLNQIQPTNDNLVPADGSYSQEQLIEISRLNSDVSKEGVNLQTPEGNQRFFTWLETAAKMGHVDSLGRISSFAPSDGEDQLKYLNLVSKLLMNSASVYKNKGDDEKALQQLDRYNKYQEKIAQLTPKS